MPMIKEVDALADFKLTLDHFYSIVKQQVGNLQASQYVQLQATAIPVDLNTEYKWFSYGNLNAAFDVGIEASPVAGSVQLAAGARLSDVYKRFLAELLSLVEVKELDEDTLAKLAKFDAKIANNDSHINVLLTQRLVAWQLYADSTMKNRGDVAAFVHWSAGYSATQQIKDLETQQALDVALMSALRVRQYGDPSHQSVVDAFAAVNGAASRMRYPRYPDAEYGEDAKKFTVVYFASQADTDSQLYANRQLMTPGSSLQDITSSALGSFSSAIMKQSAASTSMATDWSGSGSGGWGPFSFRAEASNSEKIKTDFKSVEKITVGAKSLQAIPIDATSWFRPAMFKHELVISNKKVFKRYFGDQGELLYHATHMIVARGMNVKFTSAQNWQHDYKSDFASGGSASAKIFGVGWGASGGYSKSTQQQTVEANGHDLTLDDGDNIRLLGYVVSKNVTPAGIEGGHNINFLKEIFV